MELSRYLNFYEIQTSRISTGGSSTYEHVVTETDRNREVVQGLHARLLKQRSGSLEWT